MCSLRSTRKLLGSRPTGPIDSREKESNGSTKLELLDRADLRSDEIEPRNVFGDRRSSPRKEKRCSPAWMRGPDYERMRKLVARYASPSCIKKNGCIVHMDLENTIDPDNLNIKYTVATLVRDFLRKNRASISTWKTELNQEGVVILPGVFHSEGIQKDIEDLMQTFRRSHAEFRQNGKRSCWANITNAKDGDPASDLRYLK